MTLELVYSRPVGLELKMRDTEKVFLGDHELSARAFAGIIAEHFASAWQRSPHHVMSRMAKNICGAELKKHEHRRWCFEVQAPTLGRGEHSAHATPRWEIGPYFVSSVDLCHAAVYFMNNVPVVDEVRDARIWLRRHLREVVCVVN